ncbi:hypothetical protein RIF29_15057 [Crotalaria pallida]|uniref:Uncharacterized protein n=1 Tax=Crotalaria pallida TaxID=3830 RepID=A0AAN9FJD2_CROPI
MKGYILYDLSSRETFVSRNVAFYGCVFPFSDVIHPSASIDSVLPPTHNDPTFDMIASNFDFLQDHSNPNRVQIPTPHPTKHHIPDFDVIELNSSQQPHSPHNSLPIVPIRKSSRLWFPPYYLQ